MIDFIGAAQVSEKWGIDIPKKLREELQKGDFLQFYKDDKNVIYVNIMPEQDDINQRIEYISKKIGVKSK